MVPRRWARLGSVAVVLVLSLAFAPAVASATETPSAPHLVPHAPPSALPLPRSSAVRPTSAPSFAPSGRVVFNAPGPRPGSWAVTGLPPGGEALAALEPRVGSASWGSGGGSGSSAVWQNRFCTGVWPSFSEPGGGSPQGAYASGCYGHDEPGINFYSTLPGSGGNVSWNFSLPVDRSPTLNQSSDYVAIWLGMTLDDPYAWMDQSFLELQFYPDQTFYNPGPLYPNLTVNGAWVAAAVVWQIQASTGAENPAFYEPMYLGGTPGPAFLNMTQGDQIVVVMTGWSTSPTGEVLNVSDLTNGQTSTVTLFNATGNYPLDPSYATNAYENGLEWTPGGEYPVSFAFETGHSANGEYPENNSYGGCSPGLQSTPADPAAPCPSYDPGSWANTTLRPWKLQAPTFFNAGATSHPAQVGFTQDFGGIALESQLSGGACNGEAGAAWCSYPWWSYSCRSQTFAFGATDYTGVTSDFGKFDQFAQHLQANALGFGFYAPTNFSIPTCALPSYTITVGTAGGGHAYFLSTPYATPANVTGVGAGEYALNAINNGGAARFDHWATTGAVSVVTPSSAYTTLDVNGSGTATAVFRTNASTTAVTFTDTPKGSVGVDPGITYQGPFTGTGDPIGTFASGSSETLTPGIYSLQAYPTVGYNFTGWSANNSGVTFSAPSFPYTWLVVTGAAATSDVTATYTRTTVGAVAELEVVGNGTVTLGPLTVTDAGTPYAIGLAHPRVGTWPISAAPGTGTNAVQYLYSPSGLMTNFSSSSLITLEQGLTFIEAVFYENVSVSLVSHSPAEGWVSLLAPSTGPQLNVSLGLVTGNYTVTADAAAGYAFSAWTTTGGVAVGSSGSPVSTLSVIGPGSATAWFTSVATTSVHLGAKPWWGGSELFDGVSAVTVPFWNSSVGVGEHWASATPAAGWVFSGWNVTGGVNLIGPATAVGQVFNVSGSGRLMPVFAPGVFPVTFVAWKPSGVLPPGAILTVAGTKLTTGDTVWLASGTYHATIATGNLSVQHWTATTNLTLRSGNPAGVTIVVIGSGTVYALLGGLHPGGNGSGSGGVARGPAVAVHAPPNATTSLVTGSGISARWLEMLRAR